MSHLLIITAHHATVTPPVDTEAAVTALRILAATDAYDTRPHGSDRLVVIEPDGLAAARSRAERSRT